jgi:HlyD family secretion protein
MNEHVAPQTQTIANPGQLVRLPGASVRPEGVGAHKRYWIGGALMVLAAAVAASVVWWGLGSNNTIRYTAIPVSRGAVTRAVTATGTVNPELTIIVGSYASGVIKRLRASPGVDRIRPSHDRAAPDAA